MSDSGVDHIAVYGIGAHVDHPAIHRHRVVDPDQHRCHHYHYGRLDRWCHLCCRRRWDYMIHRHCHRCHHCFHHFYVPLLLEIPTPPPTTSDSNCRRPQLVSVSDLILVIDTTFPTEKAKRFECTSGYFSFDVD